MNNTSASGKPEHQYWTGLLSQLAQKPNEAIFAELHAHFAPQIRGFLRNHAGGLSAEVAEDLCQETMCKVWFKAKSFDANKAAASTWIFTLCRNVRIDYLRKFSRSDIHNDSYEEKEEKNGLQADDIWELDDSQPFIDLYQSRNEERIQQSMQDISKEQRQALQLAYMQGLSHSEIASELELPLGTVKSRVRLGLKHLQNLIKHK
ncbi:sigma-70 family RNA polymerase sigma factor [Agaribacterium haliotis]|uniref:sigma-70 family RNA polymerase sigma factor n=1 Tax=Agaribacterium haliotis TaxID=2013869 RepID=UPI001303F51B|nr:sigma-70 family RNA polymerase sigma factor [Agaribacterium haliotis]